MTLRKEDWVERLHYSLEEWADSPFEWGHHDCALSVCNHLHAITGVDVAAELRGQYDSLEASADAIQKFTGTGNTLEHAVEKITATHGFLEVPIQRAHRGDVLLFDTPQGHALGIVSLNGRDAVLTGSEGLRRLKVLHARRAWHVPFK